MIPIADVEESIDGDVDAGVDDEREQCQKQSIGLLDCFEDMEIVLEWNEQIRVEGEDMSIYIIFLSEKSNQCGDQRCTNTKKDHVKEPSPLGSIDRFDNVATDML